MVLAVVFWAARAEVSAASDGETDLLIVGGQADDRSSGDGGGGGQALWLHPLGTPGTLSLGASYFSLAGTQWGYFMAGFSGPVARRLSLDAQLSAGRGEAGGGEFDYKLYKGLVSCALRPKRLYGEVGVQYLDIADRRGSVASAGLTLVPATSIDLSVAYYRAVSANFDSEFGSLRLGLSRRGVRWIGGASVGTFTPEVFNVIGGAPGTRSTEVFLGSEIPLGAQRLTILGRRLDLGDEAQRSLVLVWKVPLRAASGIEKR
jgi:hypothetical protein